MNSSSLVFRFFETGSTHFYLEITHLSKLTGQQTSEVPGLTPSVHAATEFCCEFWRLNLGPCACKTSPLLTAKANSPPSPGNSHYMPLTRLEYFLIMTSLIDIVSIL